jgi:hypothetical protein
MLEARIPLDIAAGPRDEFIIHQTNSVAVKLYSREELNGVRCLIVFSIALIRLTPGFVGQSKICSIKAFKEARD